MLPGLTRLPLDAPLPSAPDLALEDLLREAGHQVVAGVDEVGRGCLAGPVVAAAVVLPPGFALEGLTDSKQMPEPARVAASLRLREQVPYGIGVCSVAEIDRWNILRASLEAMLRAIRALPEPPDFLLVDGSQTLPTAGCLQQTVIKGDARSLSIAAASVIAKVERDRLMTDLHAAFPAYGWDGNVGYGTADHLEALAQHGATEHHRRSFRLGLEDRSQMTLF